MEQKYSPPNDCLCLKVSCANMSLEHENVYFPALRAKDENDPGLLHLKKVFTDNFPEYKDRTEIIKFNDHKEDKLFFLEGHFLDYPILIEKRQPKYFFVTK